MTSLLDRHLAWLARGDRNHKPRSEATIRMRRQILLKVDRDLPDGLERASSDELYAWFAPYRAEEREWTWYTYDSALRVFYGWAAQHGTIEFDPMVELGKPGEGPRIPSPCSETEYATAMAAPQWPWRRAVILAAEAGLRCAEICTVTSDRIINGHLVVKGKGGRTRTVPISPTLAAELETPSGSRHLLVGARGLPLRPQILTQMQRPAWDALGLPKDFHLHSLRHRFVTQLGEAGVDPRVIQELAGWSSLEMAMSYWKVFSHRKTDAVGRLPLMGHPEPGSSRLGASQAA